MREIRLGSFYRDESGSPREQDRQEIQEDIDQARENGARVIAAATWVENLLEEIITSFFFNPEDRTKTKFFRETVLEAHFFSFHSKWKVFRAILKEQVARGLMTSERRRDICRASSDIISWRNAFAHGELLYRDEEVYLRYFEGEEQEQVLSDEYWLGVEELFSRALEDVVSVRDGLRWE